MITNKQTRLKLIVKKRNSFLVETCGEELTYDGPRFWIVKRGRVQVEFVISNGSEQNYV